MHKKILFLTLALVAAAVSLATSPAQADGSYACPICTTNADGSQCCINCICTVHGRFVAQACPQNACVPFP